MLGDRELSVLRNQAKAGVGFFEAGNFYPDFMVWVRDENRQWLTFVDPKGIRNLNGFNSPKIQLATAIKVYEERYAETAAQSTVTLNSFIVSRTPKADVDWWSEERAFAEHHVLFQTNDGHGYVDQMMRRVLG